MRRGGRGISTLTSAASRSKQAALSHCAATPGTVADGGAAVGVMAFCWGVGPVALHLEASMAAPERFATAQRVALFTAFAAYVIVGAGVARLYDGPAPDDSVPGNVLDALPTGLTPTLVRLAMA